MWWYVKLPLGFKRLNSSSSLSSTHKTKISELIPHANTEAKGKNGDRINVFFRAVAGHTITYHGSNEHIKDAIKRTAAKY
jgi:hypothetical protein